MDDRYTIDTPEHIAFDYDVAGIGSRFLAAIVDSVILAILLTVVLTLTALVGASAEALFAGLDSLLLALLGLLNFALFWGYFLFFEQAWNGQTPGKRLVGLRVVREGGRPITLAAAAVRNLVRIVDFLPMFYGVGVVVMFVDGRSRRLGDLAAGTLVVKDRRTVTLESLTASTPPAFAEAAAAAPALTLPNLHLLAASDYDLVQEFLRRRPTLRPEVRQRLGAQLATKIRERLELAAGEPDEALLQRVAFEYALLRRAPELYTSA
jgi:uncharacterized RDD family membrane protein YckC